MKVLLTGAQGFIGRNLSAHMQYRKDLCLSVFGHKDEPSVLDALAHDCDVVIHLAGVNRPQSPEDFTSGNLNFTRLLVNALKNNHNTCPIIFASSIQAELSNSYGLSKKASEEILFAHGRETGARVLIYRLPNVFGKWCRPFYNSAVATFCHQIAHGQPVHVDDRNSVVTLTYVDDVVEEFIRAICGGETRKGSFCTVPAIYSKTLGEIVDLLYSFEAYRDTLGVPNQADDFERKLYSTYLTYLAADGMNYPLKMNSDHRGSFTEIIRTQDRGQFSVSVTKPGITRGKHWHQSKNEKFLVVSGIGTIELRQFDRADLIVYEVSGEKLEVIEIPSGYAHNIKNTGQTDLVTFIWSNEPYDPENPDTLTMLPSGDQDA